MSIHITRASEPITIQTVIILVYGQPGIGKTSLASTSESPLLLDFDRGAHRSGFRRDTVQVERWGDISSRPTSQSTRRSSSTPSAGYST
jgi:hypothetical protein